MVRVGFASPGRSCPICVYAGAVANGQLSVVTFSPEDGPRAIEIDAKSLFRNILPATPFESIFCGEARNLFKKLDLRINLSMTESTSCKHNIDNKDLTFDGGGAEII